MATKIEGLKPVWEPSSTVTKHDGQSLSNNMIFFCVPPPEIGDVLTAESTLIEDESNKPPKSGLRKYFSWFIAFFKQFNLVECSYVGKQGWCRFTQTTDGMKKNLLEFKGAVYLYSARSRVYESRSCKSMLYEFKWFDKDGQLITKINEREAFGLHLLRNTHALLISAEKAWTNFIRAHYIEKFSAEKKLLFPISASYLKGDNYICLGLGNKIKVVYAGYNLTLGLKDIEPVQPFYEKPTGARFQSREELIRINKLNVREHKLGVTTITVRLGEVANSQLLLDLISNKQMVSGLEN